MMIIIVVGVLILVSIAMSLWSLKNMQKMHEVTKAKEDLSRSKILFQRDSDVSEATSREEKV